MYYDDSYRNHSRLSFSSIVLLVIFVSAFALILTAIIWRPWADGDPAVTPPVAGAQDVPQAPADDSAVVEDDGADTGVEAVTGP